MVSVVARETYYEPARPFPPETSQEQRDTQQVHDDVLDIEDVMGERLIDTRLLPKITIRRKHSLRQTGAFTRGTISQGAGLVLSPIPNTRKCIRVFCWCREGGRTPHDLTIGGFRVLLGYQ